MNLSRLFILRPVATTLSMLAIVLAGIRKIRMEQVYRPSGLLFFKQPRI